MPVKDGHHTEKTKERIRLALKGRPSHRKGKHLTEEHKDRLSESHKGKSLTKEHKNKISKALSGEKNHNYGKHLSEDTKRKLSESHKGKSLTKEHRKKISESCSGKNNGFYGKHHSEKTKQEIRKSSTGHKNGPPTKEHREKISKARMGHIVTEKTRNKIRMGNIDWDFYNEHGCLKRNYPYNDCFTKEFKDKIRALYDNKCVVTGMTNEEHKVKYGMSLHVHHWLYNKDETDPFYFVPVTNEINGMANKNKSEWIELFNGIAEDKYCEMMR